MPCRCGMSDNESIESLRTSDWWLDIRKLVDMTIEMLLDTKRLNHLEMDENQAKKAFLKLVEHKLYGCDEKK